MNPVPVDALKMDEDFYAILGCGESSTVEQITTEYRIRALRCHPDKNPDEQSLAEFQRLQEAKDTLCDPEKRKAYDRWRCSGLMMSWKQWKDLQNTFNPVWHWATPKTEGRMLNDTKPSESRVSANPPPKPYWERDTSSSFIRKFRNYEI